MDARERFNRREICAADAVGQQQMSKDISCVVQGNIGNLAKTMVVLRRDTRRSRRGGGGFNRCGSLAGDAPNMKIEAPIEKPVVWMYQLCWSLVERFFKIDLVIAAIPKGPLYGAGWR